MVNNIDTEIEMSGAKLSEVSLEYVLQCIDTLVKNTDYIKDACKSIVTIANDGDTGVEQAEAIKSIVTSRETTNQQLIKLLEKMYDDLKPCKFSLKEQHKQFENGDQDNGSNQVDNEELLNQAINLVVNAGQASVSLVQKEFRIGYARAAKIIDQMVKRGIISRHEPGKLSKVMISKIQWQEMQTK